MAKRHQMVPGDWESIIGRLQELVLANSGEDAFEEIFKLLLAKLVSERDFSKTLPSFSTKGSAAEVAARVNTLIDHAADLWPGTVDEPPFSRLHDDHLAICIEALEPHSISDTNIEVLDGLFEYLVSRAAKGAKGQYFTPRHVIDACVRILDPQPGERIADPAAGSGGFLLHAWNHVHSRNPDLALSEYAQECLWGFEFDSRAARVARALMVIAGVEHRNIFRLNSLLTPDANLTLFSQTASRTNELLSIEDVARSRLRNFKGFDVILTNPPFAGEIKEGPLLQAYELARSGRRMERDVLFLERCIQLLAPGGRIAIVLPHNKFGSSSWEYVREWVLRRVRVLAVLGLPREVFLPHTHQKTSVLIGVKRSSTLRRVPKEDILFLISELAGKDSKGQLVPRVGAAPTDSMWFRADHDLEELVERFEGFRSDSLGEGWQ